MREFTERLAGRVAELGWSARTVSQRSGINIGTVSHALRGTRHTSERTARELARVLGDPGLLDVHRRLTGQGPSPVPTQLPRRSWITGRDALIEKAVEFALANPHPAIIITGPGGVGKTALAIEISYRVVDAGACPHGQLFTDCLGWTPGQQTVPISDVLASWARALGGDPGGDELHRVRAVYREITSGKRLLVVADNIDNAQRDEAAEIGLPHPQVLTVVTSRDREVGGHRADDDSVLRLELDGLDQDAAVTVLARRSGLQTPQLAPLAEASGGLPLVLVGVAGQLSRYKRLDPPALGEMIEAMTDNLLHPGDPLWHTISASYQSLPEPAQRAWRWCAEFGPVVPLPIAAALLDVPADAARRLLDDTGDLLQPAGAGWRYLDLHLDFARSVIEDDPSARADGRRRALAWLATAFVHGGEALSPGRGIAPTLPEHPVVRLPGNDRAVLLTWLDRLWAVWPTAVRAALDAGEHDWAWITFAAAINYAFFRKPWTRWDTVAAELAAALPADHHAGQGWAAHVRGTIAGERGALDEGLRFGTAAIEHRRALRDDRGLGWSALVAARWRLARGDDLDAITGDLHVAREAFSRADLDAGIANAALMAAGAYVRDGDLDAAEHALDDAADHIDHDDPTLRALVAEQRGRLHLIRNDLDAAEHALTEARTIADDAGDTWALIGILAALADLATARGDHTLAARHRGEAAALADALGDPRAPHLSTTQ